MEDRIQINGTWYVREELCLCDKESKTIEEVSPIHPNDLTFSEEVIYENDDFCWVASRLFRDKDAGTYFDSIDIRFTDKRTKPWKEELWDSNGWIRGVLNNDPDSLESAFEIMGTHGTAVFREFLKVVVKMDWLKN